MVQIVSGILAFSLCVVVHELVEGAVCAFVGGDLRLCQVLVLALIRRWIYQDVFVRLGRSTRVSLGTRILSL